MKTEHLSEEECLYLFKTQMKLVNTENSSVTLDTLYKMYDTIVLHLTVHGDPFSAPFMLNPKKNEAKPYLDLCLRRILQAMPHLNESEESIDELIADPESPEFDRAEFMETLASHYAEKNKLSSYLLKKVKEIFAKDVPEYKKYGEYTGSTAPKTERKISIREQVYSASISQF